MKTGEEDIDANEGRREIKEGAERERKRRKRDGEVEGGRGQKANDGGRRGRRWRKKSEEEMIKGGGQIENMSCLNKHKDKIKKEQGWQVVVCRAVGMMTTIMTALKRVECQSFLSCERLLRLKKKGCCWLEREIGVEHQLTNNCLAKNESASGSLIQAMHFLISPVIIAHCLEVGHFFFLGGGRRMNGCQVTELLQHTACALHSAASTGQGNF